jgi:hypothetical protein
MPPSRVFPQHSVRAFRSIFPLSGAHPAFVPALRLHLFAHRPTWRDIFQAAAHMKPSRTKIFIAAGAVLSGAGLAIFDVSQSRMLWERYTPRGEAEQPLAPDYPKTPDKHGFVEPLAPAPPTDSSLAVLAAWIRPRLSEERWRRIDWVTSLSEAQSLAQKCNRLVFLWGSNEPCGRC